VPGSPEEGVGGVLIGDAGEAELGDEPVLQRAKEAFDAPLGLRAAGGDPADAQFLQGAGDLCGRGFPGELLLEGQRGPFGPVEDPMAIAVGGDGDAFGLREPPQRHEVPAGIFFVPKRGGGDFPGRVIHDCQQGQVWATLVEPGVSTAVELDEQSCLGHALPASAVPGWASPAGAAEPGGAEDAAHRGAGEDDPLAFGQQLREVLVVHVGVGRGRQRHDPGPEVVGDPVRRGPSAIAVDEGCRSAGAVGPAQSADLAGRPPQEIGGFGHEERSAVEGREDLQVLLRTWRQGNHASPYSAGSGGRTFSLTT